MLRHFYDIIPAKQDSNSKILPGRILRIQLTHTYEFAKNSYIENNAPANYYPQIFDSLRTNTNYTSRTLENEIAILALRAKKDSTLTSGWEAKGFLRSQNVDFSNNLNIVTPNNFGLKTTNLSAGGFARINFKQWLVLAINAEAFFAGFNSGDIFLKAQLSSKPIKNLTLRTGIESFSQEADYRMQFFVSNYNSWSAKQPKLNMLKLFANLDLEKQRLNLEVANQLLGNYLYMNDNQTPELSTSALNVLSASITHKFRYKKWGIQSKILLQQVSNTTIIRLPVLQFQESFFREGLLSGTTPWRIGIDVIGSTSFRANSYSPYGSFFYLQNTKSNQGLLQANAYISAKIKRARVFVMLEHANANLGGLRADIIPFYPLPDRLLKIGLSWVFFD